MVCASALRVLHVSDQSLNSYIVLNLNLVSVNLSIIAKMLSNKFISEARFGKLDFDNPTSSIVWLLSVFCYHQTCPI